MLQLVVAVDAPRPPPPAVGVATPSPRSHGLLLTPDTRPCAATLACTSKALTSLVSCTISRRQLDLRFHHPSLTISRRPNLHFLTALASLSAQSAPPPEICAATQTSTAPS